MRAITKHVPPRRRLALSEQLGTALDRYRTSTSPSVWMSMRLSPSARAEALQILETLEKIDLTTPADSDQVFSWLAALCQSVRNRMGPDDLEAIVPAFVLACSDLPAMVWNVDTQRDALRKFYFFPSAAEVRELLAADSEPFMRDLAILQTLAARPPADNVPDGEVMVPQTPALLATRRSIADALRAPADSIGSDSSVDE